MLGIIVLTVITGFKDASASPVKVLADTGLFFFFSGVIGYLVYQVFERMSLRHPRTKRLTVLGLAFCFLMSYLAEEFFGIADITGAYVAGLVISCTPKSSYIQSKFEPLSFLLLTPVFFASVGIKAKVDGMTGSLVLFSILLLLISVATKIVGCGLGAKLCHFTGKESLQVGVGMVCRGEVALIVRQPGPGAGSAVRDPDGTGHHHRGGRHDPHTHPAEAGIPARRTAGERGGQQSGQTTMGRWSSWISSPQSFWPGTRNT